MESAQVARVPAARHQIPHHLNLAITLVFLAVLYNMGCARELLTWYEDLDGDGYGTTSATRLAETQPEGFAPYSGDCDDTNFQRYPDAPELCDLLDNDCDDEVDESGSTVWYRDEDGDGFGGHADSTTGCTAPEGYVRDGTDCVDEEAAINPWSLELCDGADNDCDGQVDEAGGSSWYADEDGDGFGALEVMEIACDPPEGLVSSTGDCDDGSASVYPGAADIADDGVDSDCGGNDAPQPSLGLEASEYDSIQTALDAASAGETLWVGPGSYSGHDLNFHGKALTLRSTEGATVTTVDAESQGRVFVFSSSESAETVLQGFTLTGGSAPDDQGGGLFVKYASPTILDCIFRENSAKYGAGAAFLASESRMARCEFHTNVADAGGGALNSYNAPIELTDSVMKGNSAWYGGAIGFSGEDLRISNCRFEANTAELGGAIWTSEGSFEVSESSFLSNHAGDGGGIYAESSSVVIQDCDFLGNQAEEDASKVGDGGGAYFTGSGGSITRGYFYGNRSSDVGGGLYLESSAPKISQTVLSSNLSEGDGGGAYFYFSSPSIDHCVLDGNESLEAGGGIYLFLSSPTSSHCLISRNAGGQQGGGLFLSHSSPRMEQVVVSGNRALEGGGLYLKGSSSPKITNAIFAYDAGMELFNDVNEPGTPTVLYSNLYSAGVESNLEEIDGTVRYLEPAFMSYGEDGMPSDFHLASSSALIDQGDPEAFDADGSTSDMGIYGGEGGAEWDLDGDTLPDYFWPGSIADAPAGFDPANYDVDDMDW